MAKLLNYLASNPNAELQYRASGMQLDIHSDISYFSVSKARSQASGVHFISEGPSNPKNLEDFIPTVNVIILDFFKIMYNIMASAAVAEYGTIFINTKTAVPIRNTLNEMGWKQEHTAIQIDNSTAVGIAKKYFRQRKSKAIDM